MIIFDVKVTGVEQAQAKLRQVDFDLSGAEMKGGMMEACLWVTRDAMENAPVDTGRLRASITPEVRVRDRVVEGVVGSNVKYAPYLELGTGSFAGRRPYFPPWKGPKAAELILWASRHEFPNAFLVARAIWRRGGLRPLRYLQRAFESNKNRIVRLIGNVVGKIVAK